MHLSVEKWVNERKAFRRDASIGRKRVNKKKAFCRNASLGRKKGK